MTTSPTFAGIDLGASTLGYRFDPLDTALDEIAATGLLAEFGHNNNQHLPEVSSLGWKYANLRVDIQY